VVPLLKGKPPPSRAKRGEVMRDAIQPVVECVNCGRNVAIQPMVEVYNPTGSPRRGRPILDTKAVDYPI